MNTRRIDQFFTWRNISAALFVVGLSLISPMVFAAANPLDEGANWFLEQLQSPVMRTLAVIAIIVVGVGLLFGRLDKRIAFTIIAGILIIFSADWFVDEFLSAIT